VLTLNPALLYIYWKYAPIVLAQEEARITLFEGGSGEIVNGTKDVGFTYNVISEGPLVFEGGKILFENGTVLLSN
jgi:hypothetical protein